MLRTPVSGSFLLQVCTQSQLIGTLHAQNSSLLLIPASSLHTVTGNSGIKKPKLKWKTLRFPQGFWAQTQFQKSRILRNFEKLYHRHAFSTMLLLYHVLQWFKGCALNLDNSNKTIVKRGIGATSLKARGDGIFSPYIRPIRDFWICVWAQNPCGNLNVFHLSFGFLMVVGFSFFVRNYTIATRFQRCGSYTVFYNGFVGVIEIQCAPP